jgi:hypothetical protein
MRVSRMSIDSIVTLFSGKCQIGKKKEKNNNNEKSVFKQTFSGEHYGRQRDYEAS